MTWA
jgi:transposase